MTSSPDLDALVKAATGATTVRPIERLQSLWSGYGAIVRYHLEGATESPVIVKWVDPPKQAVHPRGFATALSHQRKLRSYEVEATWYRRYAGQTDEHCRVPRLLAMDAEMPSRLYVLEDLDAAGFPERARAASPTQVRASLRWLARFHARFMGCGAEDLWPVGTYWHLATRPDEFQKMAAGALRDAAERIDEELTRCRFSTLVHGDAKLQNFCFDRDGHAVAAVDFQYVGAGCGMKDVAYFLSSCYSESECERYADRALDDYFGFLRSSLRELAPELNPSEVEQAWRALYPLAWADFVRFLQGWAPDHFKLHGYSLRLTRQALARLSSG